MKKFTFILLTLLSITFFSCKKNCVNCHEIKLYDDSERGVFDILAVQEACGALEKRKYVRQENTGEDAGGPYKTFWVCDLYPELDSTSTEE